MGPFVVLVMIGPLQNLDRKHGRNLKIKQFFDELVNLGMISCSTTVDICNIPQIEHFIALCSIKAWIQCSELSF
jgi:hypothetical protein